MTVQFERAIQLNGTTEMHKSIGMHRVCEIQLIARIADMVRPGLYLELGCGDGYTMSQIKTLSPKTRLVGYEHLQENIPSGVEIRQMDIFSDAVLAEIKTLIWAYQDTRVFVYTDNGDKPRELRMIAPLLKSGDILGTHDWPNEVLVPLSNLEPGEQFLLDQGFEVINELNPYIEEFASLQRFWIKR